MFKIDRRASSGPVAHDEDESDDNISLTSTVSGHDEDEEFQVENILAESLFDDGIMYYLVEWTDFPLHRSTWEPETNLGDDLRAMWEESKAKQVAGEIVPFDIQRFEDPKKKAKKEKSERHRRRNAKRKRMGLPLTKPLPNLPDNDSSDDEAVEEARIITPSSETEPRAQRSDQQKTAKGLPGPSVRRPSDSSTPSAAGPTAASSRTNKRKQTAPPQTTGYQGTARKPSKPCGPHPPGSQGRG